MYTLSLQGANGTSEVVICHNVLRETAARCMTRFSPTRVHIVTDTHVAPLYLDMVQSQFAIPSTVSIIPAGEEHKRLSTVETLYRDFLAAGITRGDVILALGGGVTGDMTGFAAATFLRGVALCQIPTTLLAQVDSSIGGKTAVDLPEGKNLVGAFYQPGLVLIDPAVLQTLPSSIFADGMAEVIKYGCIRNRTILDLISAPNYQENIAEIIYQCVSIKRDIVMLDEHDTGLRMILNFGHTIGHAAEKLGNYVDLTHGNAVAIGMVAAMRLSNLLGAPQDLTKPLVDILHAHGLPTDLPYARKDICAALLSDKKKIGQTMNFILVRQWGQAEIVPIDVTELQRLIEQI